MAMALDVYFLSLHLFQLCLPGMLLLPCQQHSLLEGPLLGCRSCCACVNVTDSMTFGKQKLRLRGSLFPHRLASPAPQPRFIHLCSATVGLSLCSSHLGCPGLVLHSLWLLQQLNRRCLWPKVAIGLLCWEVAVPGPGIPAFPGLCDPP